MADAFLKLLYDDGRPLPGDSQDLFHLGWISLDSVTIDSAQSWPHGAPANDTAPRGPDPRQAATMVKAMDVASQALATACVTGVQFSSATIEIVRGGPAAERLICRFEAVVIAAFQPNGRGTGSVAREQVTINYGKVGYARGPSGITRIVDSTASAAAAVLRAAFGR